ncbi:YceI family protein [Paraneptunicella aestuarii]|uniref:YceI family protein n=1 Tax=Paraneptunicella aestuarii TaxID=2831148 RepID=UPI001E61C8FC|nr:YceI family protein [Paraneptunicella aestuarii]UAA38901.1 YceI family protein [Paraneptunicella aestuarii]
MKNIRSVLALTLTLATLPSWAGWKLEPELSSVDFVSVKKEHIAETHHFKKLTGAISDSGKLMVNIDLASVETGIGIRNERMQNMLFEVAEFQKAVLSSDVSEVLAELTKDGSSKQLITTQQATLVLHGKKQAIEVKLLLTFDGNNKVTASVITPILIHAKDFDLEAGVIALQEIAGLSGITKTVPVTANLVFKK